MSNNTPTPGKTTHFKIPKQHSLDNLSTELAAQHPSEQPAGTPPAAETLPQTDDDFDWPDWRPSPETVVEAAAEAGLEPKYLNNTYDRLAPNRWQLQCPWRGEHDDGQSPLAYYTEPHGSYPWGEYQCQGTHAGERGTIGFMRQLKLLELAEPVFVVHSDREEEVQEAPPLPQSPPLPLSPTPSASPDQKSSIHVDLEALASDVFTPAPDTNPVVDALEARRHYLSSLGNRHHSFKCVWSGEHASDDTAEATYIEPDHIHPVGQFLCSGVHNQQRDIWQLIDYCGLTVAVVRAKHQIRLLPGELHQAVVAAEAVLAVDGRYFCAGNSIVRITHNANGLSSERVNEQTLSTTLAGVIDFVKPVRGNEDARCEPPSQLVTILMKSQDRRYLPTLAGLAQQPFYGADNRLVTRGGYDKASRIYAAFRSEDFELPEPTWENARAALRYLKKLLAEVAFASDVDFAAALCAILTAVIRVTLPQAPAFNVTATISGSGKSFLAKIIVLVASPRGSLNVTYPPNDEEASKLLLSILMEKPAVVLFDDMTGDWKSLGPLNRALTSSTTTERVLRSNHTATVDTNVLFLGTGNNIGPEKDMRRRVVSIRLDPEDDMPALRTFRGDPLKEVQSDRAKAVRAALTIVEAYRAAGCPPVDVPSIGTFEDWSSLCRCPLVWLGEPDPATSIIEQLTNDTDRDGLGAFLEAWRRCFGSRSVMVRTVMDKARHDQGLKDALFDLGIADGQTDGHKLGQYLKRNCGRRVNNLKLDRGESNERRAWKVAYFGPARAG